MYLIETFTTLEKIIVPLLLGILGALGVGGIYSAWMRRKNNKADARSTEVLADKTIVETGISLYKEAMNTVAEIKERLKSSQEREDRLQEELDEERQKNLEQGQRINRLENELNDERFLRRQLEVQVSRLELELQEYKDREQRNRRP